MQPDPREMFDHGTPVEDLRPKSSVYVENIGAFLAREIPPRQLMLDPIIPEQGLTMLYSERGVGKTHCSLGIAYAVASGSNFLRWKANGPRRVLMIDGEMPASLLQERLAWIVKAAEKDLPSEDFLNIITPDLQADILPDLGTHEGRESFDAAMEEADLIILDNLSTLSHTGKENEADSWTAMQRFLLDLRRRGKSVLICHHAGKGGGQRGTSKREDALDIVIKLQRPEDYQPDDGARFEVHLEKARSVFGDAAKSFEARLDKTGGGMKWIVSDFVDTDLEQVQTLTAQGKSVREIANETGISRSTVSRLQNRLKSDVSQCPTP